MSASNRPNIVLINPDQMRGDFMTPAGHPLISTTNLSRLASMGTYYPNTYTVCPMCGPARTSFVTGQYPIEHGVRDYAGNMPLAKPNAIATLRRNGYRAALYGKDHIIRNEAIGQFYDEGESKCLGNMDEHPNYKHSWSSGVLDKASPFNITERLTTAGMQFIDRQAAKNEPFFLTLNYQDPHPYFACPEPWASLFRAEQFELPPNFRREPVEGESRRMTHWRLNSGSLKATEDDFRRAMAMYCGQIRYVDDQVGRVLSHLESINLLRNTIVVFWSDHGEFVGDFGVTHKMPGFYESLVRVPLIIFDPSGRLPRGTSDEFVEILDVFPTLLDLCSLPAVEGSRARNLLGHSLPRADVYSEGGLYRRQPTEPLSNRELRAPGSPTHFGPGAMLRNREWKLCLHSMDQGELFNLVHDPHEMHNLYQDPNHREVRDLLIQRLTQRLLCLGQAPEYLPD